MDFSTTGAVGPIGTVLAGNDVQSALTFPDGGTWVTQFFCLFQPYG
jgi:hypothetical protein